MRDHRCAVRCAKNMPFRSKKKRFIFPCSLTVQLAEFIGSGKMTDTQTHQETSGKDKLSLQTNNPMVVDPSMKMAVGKQWSPL